MRSIGIGIGICFWLLSIAASAQTTVQVPVPPVNITIPTGCTISGTVVSCPVIPPPSGRTKIVPSGGNDDQLIYAAAAKGPIELGCTTYPCTFKLPAMTIPTNADMYCDDLVTLSDVAGYGVNDIMMDDITSGVKMSGSGGPNACLLTMPNSYAKNLPNTNLSTNQYNHCWAFSQGASNGSLIGLRLDHCGGDCVYLNNATTITIQKNIITNCIRNGISPTDKLTNVLIDSNDISLVHNANAGIMDDIDVEPNSPAGFINGLIVSNNNLHDTAGSAICNQGYNVNSSTTFVVSYINNHASNTHLPPTGGYGAFDYSNPNSGMKVTGSGNTYGGIAVKFPY
jgi:hypothetical protein